MSALKGAEMDAQIVDEIRTEIRRGACLVVVGAGASIAASRAPEASWAGLLQSGIRRVGEIYGHQLPAAWESQQLAKLHDPKLDALLDVGDELEHRLGPPSGGEYRRWLRDSVGEIAAQNWEVLDAIVQLGAVITTTNYDSLLEQAAGTEPVTWDQPARVNAVLRERPGILHWHGYWEKPESVVLSRRGYSALQKSEELQASLRAVRMLKTILFVGFGAGLDDPHFGALWQWARAIGGPAHEARNYILLSDSDCRESDSNRILVDRLMPVSYGPDHGGLPMLLRELGSGRPHCSVRPERVESARPEHSELLVEWRQVNRTVLVKAYRPGWHLQWDGGGYDSHRDFLWLEYEVQRPRHGRPLEVLLQVESPRYADDPQLNGAKAEIIEHILAFLEQSSSVMEIVPSEKGLKLSDEAVRRNKSTTVAKFGMPREGDELWELAAESAMIRIDKQIGDALDQIWKDLTAQGVRGGPLSA